MEDLKSYCAWENGECRAMREGGWRMKPGQNCCAGCKKYNGGPCGDKPALCAAYYCMQVNWAARADKPFRRDAAVNGENEAETQKEEKE
jgi:hypothetical protein